MKFSAKITGQKAIRAALERSGNKLYQGAVEQLKESTLSIHANAIKLIQENNDGVATIRYTNGRARVVRTSLPGEPPNTDTGRLVKSIGFEFSIPKFGGKLTARVGTNLKYGAWLEFGTEKMKPRPWLSRAMEFEAELIQDDFKTKLQDALGGS